MRYSRKMSAMLGATVLLAGIGVAAAQNGPSGEQRERLQATPPIVYQDNSDALIPPRMWDCEHIVPEYRDWIENGNAPEAWKYSGQLYRDEEEARNYDWAQWLDWYEQACPVAAWLPESAASAQAQNNATGAITTLAAASGWLALTSGSGSDDRDRRRPPPPRNDSPG